MSHLPSALCCCNSPSRSCPCPPRTRPPLAPIPPPRLQLPRWLQWLQWPQQVVSSWRQEALEEEVQRQVRSARYRKLAEDCKQLADSIWRESDKFREQMERMQRAETRGQRRNAAGTNGLPTKQAAPPAPPPASPWPTVSPTPVPGTAAARGAAAKASAAAARPGQPLLLATWRRPKQRHSALPARRSRLLTWRLRQQSGAARRLPGVPPVMHLTRPCRQTRIQRRCSRQRWLLQQQPAGCPSCAMCRSEQLCVSVLVLWLCIMATSGTQTRHAYSNPSHTNSTPGTTILFPTHGIPLHRPLLCSCLLCTGSQATHRAHLLTARIPRCYTAGLNYQSIRRMA